MGGGDGRLRPEVGVLEMTFLNPWDWTGGRSKHQLPNPQKETAVPGLVEKLQHLENEQRRHHDRLSAMETWSRETTVSLTEAKVRWQNMDEKLDKIESGVWWAVKLIIGGLIMGGIAFILSGGFKVP